MLQFHFFLFISCAHHKDVRPGADGIHRVVIYTDDSQGAGRSALSQAESFCKEIEKRPGIIEEKTTYIGKVDEETYNSGKAVSRVLKTVGGANQVFGGRNESNAGGVGVLAGIGTDAALGNGYTTEMKFKCQ